MRRFALAKVAAEPSEEASVSRNEKRVSYGTVLNTCLSFLNEVKNLAEVRDIKCVFLYPMPDSSLLITICFLIFHFFMYAYHRSRMTAGVLWVFL